jgi:hypothetical protein
MAFMPADRQYLTSLWSWMAVYAVAVFGVPTAIEQHLITGPAIYVAAMLPSIPIAAIMWAVIRLMARSDEYVRAITAKRMILATGLCFFLSSAWGFIETYAPGPHIPLWMVFPIFWGCFGVVSPFVKTSA